MMRNPVMLMGAVLLVGLSGMTSASAEICGLEYCSEYPGGKSAYQENWHKEFLSFAYDNSDVDTAHQDDHRSEDYHSDDADIMDIIPSAHSADSEFPAQLDLYIHKFELDKISADETLDGIGMVYHAYVDAGITNEIIENVGEKIELYDNGILGQAEAIEAIHLSAEPQNVNPEYQGALDEIIHRFELDKISADEALEGIREVHGGFVGLYITSDLIEAVDEKIGLIDSGMLSGADAIESIHLSAEPQNVNPEFVGAIEPYLEEFESGEISADEAIAGIKESHDGFVDLYITSDLVDAIGNYIGFYNSDHDQRDVALWIMRGAVDEAKAELEARSHGMEKKELPPNTVDMPAGTGIPGCEEENLCYIPAHIAVDAGTTVTWINSDSIAHTVTAGWPDSDSTGADYPGGNGFDSGLVLGGQTFEHTFDVPGEYDYYCVVHPWMLGSVTVE